MDLRACQKPFEFGISKLPPIQDAFQSFLFTKRRQLIELLRTEIYDFRGEDSLRFNAIISEVWSKFIGLESPPGYQNIFLDVCFDWLHRKLTELINPAPGCWPIFTIFELDFVLQGFVQRLREVLDYM